MGIGESVFSCDLGRDIASMDTHVLVDFHVGGEEKIFEVSSAVASTIFGIGDGAVEMKFGINNANSWRADTLESVKMVATDSHANATWFCFAGSHGADKVGIGDFATMRDLGGENEKHRVVAEDGCLRCARFGETGGAATPFVGEGQVPDGAVGAMKKGVNGFFVPSDGVVDLAGGGGVVMHGCGDGHRRRW